MIIGENKTCRRIPGFFTLRPKRAEKLFMTAASMDFQYVPSSWRTLAVQKELNKVHKLVGTHTFMACMHCQADCTFRNWLDSECLYPFHLDIAGCLTCGSLTSAPVRGQQANRIDVPSPGHTTDKVWCRRVWCWFPVARIFLRDFSDDSPAF
jgi:hypothetical protein